MARPTLPLGTAGAVTTSRDGSGWHARCRYRDYDGEVRQIQRHGRTEARAKHALAEAVRDRSRPAAGGELHPDSRVTALAEAWFVSLQGGKRSPTTLAQYRYRLDRQIIPVIGKLRIRELSAGRVDAYLRDTTTTYGPSTAKMVRSVLSGMCGIAVRQDLLDRNPVRDASHISVPVRRAPRSLTLAEARQLRALVTYDDRAIARDLPDLISFMLATGVRLGRSSRAAMEQCRHQDGLDRSCRHCGSRQWQRIGNQPNQDDNEPARSRSSGVDTCDAQAAPFAA